MFWWELDPMGMGDKEQGYNHQFVLTVVITGLYAIPHRWGGQWLQKWISQSDYNILTLKSPKFKH